MSKHLAELLDQPQSVITKAISALEDLSGYPSEDVRLLAEILGRSRVKKSQLGLDPDDTTDQELYHGLLARFEHDSRHFASDLGFSQSGDVKQQSQNLVKLAKQLASGPEVLALKRSVARELLQKTPPRHLMKILNCRSVSSMLKHYDIIELYSLLPTSESANWRRKFWQHGSTLGANDFETRAIEVVTAPGGPQKIVAPIEALPILGSIVIWPIANPGKIVALAQSILLVEAIDNVQIYSLCLQYNQFQKNFGRLVADVMQNGLHPLATVGGHSIPWRILREVYKNPTALESSTLTAGYNYSAASVLAQINPVLKWWVDNDYLAARHKKKAPVSLNVVDVAKNYLHGLASDRRITNHFQHNLWEEMLRRYSRYPAISSYILGQLDNKQLAPETIKVVSNSRLPVSSGLSV